jgi:signal peptidase I
METPNTRKPHVVLAFLAGLSGFGLGYLYVGKLRFGVASLMSFCLMICLFAWSRSLVQSPLALWVLAAIMVSIALFALIHPIVVAAKNRKVPTKRYNRWWIYVLWSLATTALGPTIFFARATLLGYETFGIPTSAMSPTIEKGDYVLTDSWRYPHHAAVVGEIVIVVRPENPNVKYIKRVVGVAGDTIEIRGGRLYRNGEEVAEPYLHAPISYGGAPKNMPSLTLGPGLIFLLGDYRDNSMDSRQWGPFPVSSLRGRAQYIWLSMEDSKVRWGRIGTSLEPPKR